MALEMLPFEVRVSDQEVEDLRERLARVRWPDQLPGSGWDYGADRGYVAALCDHWRTDYDWRGFESRLNRFPQWRARIGGERLHFYHVRSPEPDARPLLLGHGWPSSPAEFLDVIGPLSDPRAHGGDPHDAFHVIVPSLPGYAFSGPTSRRGYRGADIASAFDTLMRQLGYDRYFIQAGDKSVGVAIWMAAAHADRIAAIHLNLLAASPPDPTHPEAGLDETECADWQRTQRFLAEEAGYQAIQRTKPQSLAFGLADSPAGLAAWLVEKYRSWSDCGGDIERRFGRDMLLDWISIYWLTNTINSSMRLYFEDHGPGRAQPLPRVTVSIGHARFPAEIMLTPRAWAERSYNIASWREMPEGGHFPAAEVPVLYIEEVRRFFRAYR